MECRELGGSRLRRRELDGSWLGWRALGDSKLEQRELGGSRLGWTKVDDSKLMQKELGGSRLTQLQGLRHETRFQDQVV